MYLKNTTFIAKNELKNELENSIIIRASIEFLVQDMQ